ncbi:3-ketoacyl-CoA thiolase, peroxisomal [Nosema granulosis]|uniref:acetyl-CoA C-acyltransferase n=1 Tax=Nosema granulosis TaxID=83296 RepID=A0A9P6KZI7_9MICR|nr:3-ketoacyl-CoA thiolase, peroxisomal [Nosema granulosis]
MSSRIRDSEDIVIVGAYRTPICKAKRGGLSGAKNDVLVSEVIKGTLKKTGLKPEHIQEVVLGHGLSPLNGTTSLRMGVLRAGIPLQVPVSTCNRQCASGLESLSVLFNKIKLNQIEIGLGGGFESMTGYSLPLSDAIVLNGDQKQVVDCTLPMGGTAEILARKHNVSRSKCDVFAFTSHEKSLKAQKQGKYKSEIVTVQVENRMVYEDDCIRETSIEKLKSLRPVFALEGVCTAGNSCQLADGASAIIMMKRKTAEEMNITPKAAVVDYVVVGVEPSVMGEGPVPAVREILRRNNLEMKDISYFEINEAFAAQTVYCIEELGVDYNKVNLYGGSIALGHPIGSTGSRLVCTLLNVMKTEGIRGYAIATLCVGTGFGAALLLWIE